MINILGKLLTGPVIEVAGKALDRAIPDKNERAAAKERLTAEILKSEAALAEAASRVIVAEATGHSWAQRNWRPCLMFVIMGLLVWNGVGLPLVAAIFGVAAPQLTAWNTIPPEMWTLLTVGVGGYIAGRSGEKIAQHWSQRGD